MTGGRDPVAELAELARTLRGGASYDQVYRSLCEHARGLVEGCDRAAIAVLEGDQFRTVAATDDVMREIDTFQQELREGPCYEASVEQEIQLDNDLTDHSHWPRLAKLVVERTPVRAVLAVPLVHEGRRSGALNLFADRPGAFTEESLTQAAIVAAFAAVALTSASQQERAEQYAVALETNREIGAAVGILMATHRIGQEEAFQLLSQASQRLNRKLRDIASGIVHGERTTDL